MKQSLKRLVIDSATAYLYLALYEDQDKLASVYQIGRNNHSETLMVELQRLMTEAELKPKDLDEIYVGIGPGSYTGVRIGVVVAKILGYSLNVPIYTVSSLALLASGSSESMIVPWIDARRGYAFIGVYGYDKGVLKVLREDSYADLASFKEHTQGEYVDTNEPRFDIILQSGLYEKVEDVHTLAPIYLRKTEAETNLSKG